MLMYPPKPRLARELLRAEAFSVRTTDTPGWSSARAVQSRPFSGRSRTVSPVFTAPSAELAVSICGSVPFDFEGFGGGADGELQIDDQLGADLHNQSCPDEIGKSRGADGDLIHAGLQVGSAVEAGGASVEPAGVSGGRILDSDRRAGNYGGCGIGDRPGDGAAGNLPVEGAHEEQQCEAKTWPQIHFSNLSQEAGNPAATPRLVSRTRRHLLPTLGRYCTSPNINSK